MVSLTCETAREAGVTLVTARVANAGCRRRVRLVTAGDGPVWPPRTDGVPVAGWDGNAFECVLAAGETRAVGYATPARVDDPLTIAATEPVDRASDHATGGPVPDVSDDPDGVVRALGTPVPPRDAVPDPDTPLSDDESGSPAADPDDEPTHVGAPAASDEAVDAWLAAVEGRIETAESLSESTAVTTATPAVRQFGGIAGVRDAAARLDEDADRLRRVAERATALAERAEAATVPVETLDRLA